MSTWANPLIVKELRERFRTQKSMWILGIYLLVMGAIFLGFIYIETVNRAVFRPGENRELFMILAVIHSGLIGFITPALSAGTISGERERQTLNILLTTHLSPWSIVRSKLVTSLAFMLLLIFASLPLYSFVFLYGGVSPSQILHLFLFFGVNILFFGSLGLFCSTWIKRTGVATITAYGLTFFMGIGTGLLVIFLQEILRMYDYRISEMMSMQVFMSLNPGIVLIEILENGGGPIDTDRFSPWALFAGFYLTLSLLLIYLSGHLLNPMKKRWGRTR
jgi:ABC-2 type transport system permease protein